MIRTNALAYWPSSSGTKKFYKIDTCNQCYNTIFFVTDEEARFETLVRDKHTSLFDLFVMYKEKKFIRLTPVINVIILFYFVTDEVARLGRLVRDKRTSLLALFIRDKKVL